MASTIILSDNGVSSGSAGIKTTGGNDGVLILQTTTSGGTATNAVTISNTQNVGVGVTPSAWGSNVALQLTGPSLWGSSGVSHLTTNTYFDGTNYKYIASNYVTDYYQLNGNHVWRYAASGTAGANVTLSEAMKITATGRVEVASLGVFRMQTGSTTFDATPTAGAIDTLVWNTSNSGSAFAWNTNSTERMRIDSSGNLMVGATSTATNFSTKFTLSTDSGTTKWAVGPSLASATQFVVSASGSAGVYLATTSATSWSAISDERHKDIIAPITNAVQKVSTLRCVIGKYKDDETNTQKPFLIAQDVLAVQPEAVDTSNPERFGLAYTDLIPLLTAAIQEQQALITTLTERITALEAK